MGAGMSLKTHFMDFHLYAFLETTVMSAANVSTKASRSFKNVLKEDYN